MALDRPARKSAVPAVLVGFAAIVAIASSAFAAAPQVRTQAPGFYRMMLGDFEITALLDGTHPFPDAEVLTKPKPGASAERSNLFDDNPQEANVLLAAADLKAPTEGSINGVGALASGDGRIPRTSWSCLAMPHKHNDDRRHHIPKMAFKVRNWPEYEAGLRRRGSLTLWMEDAALDHWQTVGPEGQARYTDAAIQTMLMVRAAFKLAYRQTEGLMASVITLMDLTISAPDHSPISRRAPGLVVIQPDTMPHGPLHLLIDSTGLKVYGAGQWLEAKHGAKSRRKWRKLHLAVDAENGMIVAQALTDQDEDDPSQVAPLLDQIDIPIARVTADGAYDGAPTYDTIAAHSHDIEVVIPPRSTAVLSGDQGPIAQRDRHLEMITEQGRLVWQKATDYGQRSLVETTMGRYKALIGPQLRTRGFDAQHTEAAIGVAVLNRMLAAGRPDSVRRMRVIT